MAAAVVKLDALSDAVGATAQDQHLGLVCRQGLALSIIRAVHVGRGRFELSSTGVYSLVGGLNLHLLPLDSHLLLLHPCTARDTLS